MSDIADIQQDGQLNFVARRKIFRSNEAEFFFLNNAYLNAYIQLLKGIRQRGGLFVLTGEAGIGKTFLLRKLENESPTNIKLVFCYSTNLDYENLIAVICGQLGVGAAGYPLSDRIAALKEYLKTNSERRMGLALLIDDAHHLGQDVLDNLIASFSSELQSNCALRIVLSGTPILEEILKRIGVVRGPATAILQIRLEPMISTDVATYISRQIKGAGSLNVDSLFSPLAIQKITRYTGGIPRLINTLCERALLITQLDKETTVSIASIDETAHELMLKEHEVIADGVATNFLDEIQFNDKTRLKSSLSVGSGSNHPHGDTEKIFSESLLMDKPDMDLDETINESIFQNIIDYPVTAVSFSASSSDGVNQFVCSTTPTVQSKYSDNELSRSSLVENILRDEFRENMIMTTRWDDFKIDGKHLGLFELPKLQFLSLIFFAILAGLLGGVGSIYLFRQTPVPIPAASPAPTPAFEVSKQASSFMQQAPIPGPIHDRDSGHDSSQVSASTFSVSPTSTTSSPLGVSTSGSVEPVQASKPEVSANPGSTSLSPSIVEPKPPARPVTISATPSPRAGLGSSSPISASAAVAASPVAESETPPASQPSSGETVSETPLISSYMSSGDAFMARGDVASARLFYLEAAKIGFPAGMAAVGKTYDPIVLNRLGIRGFLADSGKAVEWYVKAEKAGYAETAEYLQELRRWIAGSSPIKDAAVRESQ